MSCFTRSAAVGLRVPLESFRRISSRYVMVCLLAWAGSGGQSVAAPGEETGACCDQLGDVCLEGLTREECEADQFDERRFGGEGSTCSTIEPPCESCEDVCPSCTVKQGEGTRRVVISLVTVEPVGSDTRFTYRLCQDEASQDLSHWILGLAPECCSRITASNGGSSPVTQCGLDPTTGLFGLKFETDDGIGQCGADECVDGGALFSVQLAGVVDTGCVKVVNKINGSPASAFGCVQGPNCDPCQTDADCDNSDPCSTTEMCNEQGLCVPRTEVRDCNGNGVEDLCDIANGSSSDCSGNGIPDECDIADCAGEPSCDDCNLNGVPDGCDIDSGEWPDVDPADGILDACVDPIDIGGNWTDDIWNLSDQAPNPFPDNQDGVPDLHVTIDESTIFLDATVEIQTFRLLNGGTLLVTECDIGDFGTVAAGGILNEGNLLVGGDRHINVAGADVTIGPGGRYASVPSTCATECPAGATCASLIARDMRLMAGDCESLRNGADVVLDQSMSIDLSGDLVLLGNTFFGCSAGRTIQQRGINIPPKLSVFGGSVAADSFVLNGLGEVSFDAASGDPADAVMALTGDFLNSSTDATLFDWSSGLLLLEGTTPQMFEVAGIDFGPVAAGFGELGNTNFSIDRIEVATGSDIRFVNEFANTVGDVACEEALYVRRLILRSGATLTLDNVRVYYQSLEDGGGVIETVGCGSLLGLCDAQVPQTDFVPKNRFITITTGISGRRQAMRVILEDLPAPFDQLNGQTLWVGEPANVNEAAALVTPEPGAPSFWACKLRCTPFFTDWSAFGSVQAYHEAVVPGGRYLIQLIDESCAADLEDEFSAPLTMTSARFGDVAGSCLGAVCAAPDGTIDLSDILAVINTFASVPGAMRKVRADMEPALPDFLVNISDALVVVNAFSGLPFPFASPDNPCDD